MASALLFPEPAMWNGFRFFGTFAIVLAALAQPCARADYGHDEIDHARIARVCAIIKRRGYGRATLSSSRPVWNGDGAYRRLCELYAIPGSNVGADQAKSRKKLRSGPARSSAQEQVRIDSEIYGQLLGSEQEEVELIDAVSEALGVPLAYAVGERDDGYFESKAFDLMVRTPRRVWSDALYLGLKVERTDVTNSFVKNLSDRSSDSGLFAHGVDGKVLSAFATLPW